MCLDMKNIKCVQFYSNKIDGRWGGEGAVVQQSYSCASPCASAMVQEYDYVITLLRVYSTDTKSTKKQGIFKTFFLKILFVFTFLKDVCKRMG